MSTPLFSIIDIETTGGFTSANRIIEIAIVNIKDGQIVDRYETLIHPERTIPVSISYFTGITNEMVQDAPKFYQIAKKIVEMTQNSIFVAHNVYFDFNFIKSEFASLGFTYRRPKLCTVRMSRRILPGHRSYSLGKLCADLGIGIENRHRAMGDADATAKLFKLLLEKKPDLHTITEERKEKILIPPNVNHEEYEQLPNKPGIYYFWNEESELLYIGKSVDIKKRVSSHFRLDVHNRKEISLKAAIHKITFEETGSDICAKLLECQRIKTLRPQFNRSMNRIRFPYTINWIEDSEGFFQARIVKLGRDDDSLVIRYTSKTTAKTGIIRVYKRAFGIEMGTLTFEQQLNNFKTTLGPQLFNKTIQKILDLNQYPNENFIIKQPGRMAGEVGQIAVENHRLQRIEYISHKGELSEFELSEDEDMRRIFLMYLQRGKVSMRA